MKQESKQDIILRLTEGLNAQQRSVPQLPADAHARKIKVLGSKTDPRHPFAGYMVGADESAEPGKKTIGPDKNDPFEKGWRAGFRHDESNPYPAGSKEAAQWDRGYAEAEAQPNHYDESALSEFAPGPERDSDGDDDDGDYNSGDDKINTTANAIVKLLKSRQPVFFQSPDGRLSQIRKISPLNVSPINQDADGNIIGTAAFDIVSKSAGGRNYLDQVAIRPEMYGIVPVLGKKIVMQVADQNLPPHLKHMRDTDGADEIVEQPSRVAASPFNDDQRELDQYVKEEYNRDPDDINEESGAVVAHGYAYNRQDQRVAWTREFASEAEVKEWARRRNATVLSIVPKQNVEEGYSGVDDSASAIPGQVREGAGVFNIGDQVLYKGQPAEVLAVDGTAATVYVPNWKAVPGMVDDTMEVDPASKFLNPMDPVVAEGSLSEVDRRGFLKGMGAAAVAGAAGGAKAHTKEIYYKVAGICYLYLACKGPYQRTEATKGRTVVVPPEVCQKTNQLIQKFIRVFPGGKDLINSTYANVYTLVQDDESREPFKGSVLNRVYFDKSFQQKILNDFESLIEFNESVNQGVAEGSDKECPPATQDIKLNLKNRQKAIDEYGYGPLNPDLPNTKFWMKKVDEWNLDSAEEAKQSLCGNCAAFDQRKHTLDCIAQGIDSNSPNDAEGVIDAGDLGYCKFLKFKCASRRTCDAWVTGGPLTDKQGVAEGVTPDTIHKLADRKGVKWDNEPDFLRLTKRLTGKEHLDDLAPAGLQKVKRHLDGLPGVTEGARVDRMVKHIASSEKKTGKSKKDAESIAWATVNKRGYLDNKNKKKHVAEAGTPADIRAKNRAVVKKIQGKEVKEDITQEDIITKLKAKLGDYLSDLGQQIRKDPALQDKLSAKPPGDQVGPAVKTVTTDDGHEISIHGNEDDGFRITIKNKTTPSKFSSLDEAVMACEMYCGHRRRQALNADYVEEA